MRVAGFCSEAAYAPKGGAVLGLSESAVLDVCTRRTARRRVVRRGHGQGRALVEREAKQELDAKRRTRPSTRRDAVDIELPRAVSSVADLQGEIGGETRARVDVDLHATSIEHRRVDAIEPTSAWERAPRRREQESKKAVGREKFGSISKRKLEKKTRVKLEKLVAKGVGGGARRCRI